MSHNNIGKYLNHLLIGLSANNTLTCLILSNTKIKYIDICNLFDVLANSLTVLKILKLDDNNLKSDSAMYIAESLNYKKYNISELYLSGNNFKSGDLKLLKCAIEKYSWFIIYLFSNLDQDIVNILN